jgi:hypothetical protein
MAVLTDVLLDKLVSEFGVASLFTLWILYQVYSPRWMPDTKLQKMVGEVRYEVLETKELLVSTITVLRAVVRTNDEVNTERVDDYLVENGVEPQDFLERREEQ